MSVRSEESATREDPGSREGTNMTDKHKDKRTGETRDRHRSKVKTFETMTREIKQEIKQKRKNKVIKNTRNY